MCRKQDFRDKFIKHLVIRHWSLVQVKQWSEHDSKNPRDLIWEDEKLRGPSQKSAESCGTRIFIQFREKLMTRAHMQKGEGSRRLGNRHRAKEATGWAEVGPGRPARPISGPSQAPFDLAAIWAIYRPEAKSHASIHSSSAAEEQRREGNHLGEERVELVDYGLTSRRGNLARKTTSEFPELEARSR
jgi:hypothetical protein